MSKHCEIKCITQRGRSGNSSFILVWSHEWRGFKNLETATCPHCVTWVGEVKEKKGKKKANFEEIE